MRTTPQDTSSSPSSAPTHAAPPQFLAPLKESLALTPHPFDTNQDGALSRKEVLKTIHDQNRNIRTMSCDEAQGIVNITENGSPGSTDALWGGTPQERSTAEKQVATYLSQSFNQGFGSDSVNFPSGVFSTQPKDFRATAQEIGEKIRSCALIAPGPYPKNENNEYAQNSLPAKQGPRER